MYVRECLGRDQQIYDKKITTWLDAVIDIENIFIYTKFVNALG